MSIRQKKTEMAAEFLGFDRSKVSISDIVSGIKAKQKGDNMIKLNKNATLHKDVGVTQLVVATDKPLEDAMVEMFDKQIASLNSEREKLEARAKELKARARELTRKRNKLKKALT